MWCLLLYLEYFERPHNENSIEVSVGGEVMVSKIVTDVGKVIKVDLIIPILIVTNEEREIKLI